MNPHTEQKKRRRTTSTSVAKIHPDGVTPTSLRKARQQRTTPNLLATAPSDGALVRLLQPIVNKVKNVTFLQAFGILGPPMLLVTLISLAWTIWLIILAIAPTPTANYLMDTEDYDDGRFWLTVDPNPSMVVLSVLGLGTVATGYLYILLVMLVWRNRKSKTKPHALAFRSSLGSLTLRSSQQYPRVQAAGSQLYSQWRDLTAFDGIYRKFWNACLKSIDLALQSVSLYQMLENGSPTILINTYSALICANSLSCVVSILVGKHSAFVEVLVDSIFDMLFAVMFPILVLAYCCKFEFDRAAYLLNMEVFPAGSFERRARMIADPSQIALFRVGFDSLRIQTILDFIVRIAMNLSFCNRFKRVVEILIARPSQSASSSHLRSFQNPLQKDVPRVVALLFLLFSIVLLAETQNAVHTSKSACRMYPQCVVYAFRSTSQEWCPCLTLIDVDRTPTTVDDWWNPPDATDIVKALAQSGDLRALQLINRRLFRLPKELQRCRNLQYISLMYSALEEFPPWVKELKKLEFLYDWFRKNQWDVFSPD
ncbi:hypothetical protein FI667_g14220, partial [Globisporangium splendens]